MTRFSVCVIALVLLSLPRAEARPRPAAPAVAPLKPVNPNAFRGKGAFDTPLPTAVTRNHLGVVLQRVKLLKSQGKRPIVVTDIDGTIATELENDIGFADAKPLPGAPKYFRQLEAAGATVVYLTGRKTSDRKKTEKFLRRYDFPLAKAKLMLNPSKTYGNPIEWKLGAQTKLQRLGGTYVAFFENTKRNAALFRRLYPYRDHPSMSVFYVADYPNAYRGRIGDGIHTMRPRYPSVDGVAQMVK